MRTDGAGSLGPRLTFGVLLVAGLLLWLPGSASAQTSFCPAGEGAGECGGSKPLAVDPSNGDIYFLDSNNRRVNRFDSDGDFLLSFGWGVADGATAALQSCGPAATPPTTSCFKAVDGSGPSYATGSSIAVDADGNVYLGGITVRKFDSDGHFLTSWTSNSLPGPSWGTPRIAIGGPTESVYVASSASVSGTVRTKVDQFSTAGSPIETVELTDPPDLAFGIAVDSSGNLYVEFRGGGGIFKYGPGGGSLLLHFDSGVSRAGGSAEANLAMGADDVLYVAQHDGREGNQTFKVIGKYDVSGPIPMTLSRFGYGRVTFESGSVQGIAVAATPSGGAFISGPKLPSAPDDNVVQFAEPPPGPIVAPAPDAPVATSVGSVRATLRAGINPEGKATTYRIQYVDQDSFEDEGLGGPSTHETAPIPMAQEDFLMHSALVTIGCPDPLTEASEPGKCLTPETEYRFRVLAEHGNGDEGTGPVEGEPFTTSEPLEIGNAWTTEVGATSARLHAEVNPFGVPATGAFEYVEKATCEADEADLGPSHCFDHAVHVPAAGEDPLDFGSGEDSVEQSAVAKGLEPGTAYRYRVAVDNDLIDPVLGPARTFTTFAPPQSPTDTCANAAFRAGAGARLPDCRAYELVSPLDKANGDIVTMGSFTNFVASYNQSAAQGGKLTYSSLRAFGDAQSAPLTSQYIATRDAAREEWVSTGISPPRGRNILGAGLTLDSEFKLFSEDLCAAWLLHDSDPPEAPGAVAGYANLYKRDNCGASAGSYEAITTAEPPAGTDPTGLDFELQGVSGDGQHTIYRANAALAGGATPGISNVYDSKGGAQRLVCVLPGGAATSTACWGGSGSGLFNNGRQQAVAHAVSEDGSRVFWEVRGPSDSHGALYVRLNGHGTGNECANPVRPCTVAIGEGQYWNAAADGSAALYATPTGELRVFDVDTKTSQPIAGQVEGVLGASDDLTRVYFASRETLGGEGEVGKLNLYLYEKTETGQEISFIGKLAEADKGGGKTPSPLQTQPVMHTAHATPSGDQLVFMSLASLTGADNLDADQGEPAAQVYRYEATSGELDCVSCNPSGGRPVARVLGIPTTEEQNGILAAGRIATAQNQLHASRVITDNGGRVFFESTDPLTLGDTNGVLDVYEWEEVGEGDCEEDSPAFNPVAGGCVSLISTGKSPEDSVFVDASADGADVFIATGASLLSYDPGLVDVYDARAGGGFPPPPEPLPGCEGEACQGPVSAPDDPTPASSSFEGAGNVVEEKAKAQKKARRCPKGKRQVKVKGKVRCQKQRKHHHKAKHDRRAGR